MKNINSLEKLLEKVLHLCQREAGVLPEYGFEVKLAKREYKKELVFVIRCNVVEFDYVFMVEAKVDSQIRSTY